MMDARSLLGVPILLAFAAPVSAGRIWLDPNARVPDDKALVVTIEGLTKGQKAAVTIQGDCGSGGPRQSAQCPVLWGPEETAEQGPESGLRFSIAPGKLAQLPQDRVLWVVVEASGWARPAISRFHRADPCSTLATLLQTFTGGPCTLALSQVLSELTRTTDNLSGKTFEVQRMSLGGGSPAPVPGTRGATGVAWASASELFVTSAAGLSKVDLGKGTTEQLVSNTAGEPPLAAPLALPGSEHRVAFVRQTPGSQQLGDPESVAELVLWPGGRRFPLPFKVHQLLASDSEGTRLLALCLGLNNTAPLVFEINLQNGAIDVLGFDPRIYQTLLTDPDPEPGSQQAVVAFEEVRSGRWRIGLATGGSYQRDLVSFSDRSALAPAWRSDGGEIAFLVEVKPDI